MTRLSPWLGPLRPQVERLSAIDDRRNQMTKYHASKRFQRLVDKAWGLDFLNGLSGDRRQDDA